VSRLFSTFVSLEFDNVLSNSIIPNIRGYKIDVCYCRNFVTIGTINEVNSVIKGEMFVSKHIVDRNYVESNLISVESSED